MTKAHRPIWDWALRKVFQAVEVVLDMAAQESVTNRTTVPSRAVLTQRQSITWLAKLGTLGRHETSRLFNT